MSTGNSATENEISSDNEAGAQAEREIKATRFSRASTKSKPLKIDDDFNLGGDPYNQTGQYCVLDLKDNPIVAKSNSR